MSFKIKDFLFIISLIIIFNQYTKLVEFNYYTQFIIALIWIIYDFVGSVLRHNNKTKELEAILYFKKVFLLPWLMIAIYTFILYLMHQNENVELNTYIASNSTILINILFAFSSLHIFKGNALRNSLWALTIVYALITINAISIYGISIISGKLQEVLTTIDSKLNPFEIGDCTFAAGLLLLMYLFYRKKQKKELKYFFICAFFIIIGLKRIQILSLALVTCIGLFFKFVSNAKIRNLIMSIVSITLIIISTFYLHIITERLDEWENLDMGRFNLYSFMGQYVDFHPSFLGHGYGFSNKFVELNTSFSIIVLHNDILRMYIELGFCGFYLWLLYYLFIARKKIENKYGHIISCQFFFMTIYLFITYFTDNTINYFVTQYFYCLILPTLVIKQQLK